MSVQVAVIMGSKSDWETMQHACEVLDELEIGYEKVVSAHRTPDLMFEYAEQAIDRGFKVIIAGAGSGSSSGYGGIQTMLPSSVSRFNQSIERPRFLAVYCADAWRHPGSHGSHWQSGCDKCRLARGTDHWCI